MNEIESLKRKLKEANSLICELCEKCGENVCKNGEECDWKESEVQGGMKIKFGEHIHLDLPKTVSTEDDFFDADAIAAQIVSKAVIKMAEQIDNEIINEIVAMARLEGIDDVYLLDKKNILSALEKQIPKKPDYEGDGYDDNGELIYDTWICRCNNLHLCILQNRSNRNISRTNRCPD